MSNAIKHPVTIAVAGGTGSGKTTVSNQILDRVGSTITHCLRWE